MQDNSEGNHGTEAILDFQMSWLMRLSADKIVSKTELGKISRTAMLNLLEIKDADLVCIKEVKVWKQWKYIDVIAEVTIIKRSAANYEEKHIVVIENKVYTRLRDNQLNKYSKVVLDYYNDISLNHIHFWLINCNEETWIESDKRCVEAVPKWKQLWFYDVIGGERKEPIGNDLFDEFWVYKWY